MSKPNSTAGSLKTRRLPFLFSLAVVTLTLALNIPHVNGQSLRGLALTTNAGAGAPEAIDVSIHDNWLYIDPVDSNTPITNVECVFGTSPDSYSVTSQQPYNWPPSCGVANGEGYVMFLAGRSASDPPADFFTSGLAPQNMLPTTSAHDPEPEQLNFAFIISQLTVTLQDGTQYVMNDIHLGQGSTGTSNNWWIGCSACSKDIGDRAFLDFPTARVFPASRSVDTLVILALD